MQYRKMGNLGWKVSALGFGCMRFPSKKVLFWKKVDEEEAIRILRQGIDWGINYVDTAWPYHGGKSEIIVGKALLDGYREKVHLTTKLPIWKVRSADDFDKYLNEQLKKLQTNYLDIYLFHALNKSRWEKVKKLNLIKKMEEAKEKGLIKHFGFSFHDSYDVFKEIVDYYPWELCQIQYNYMDTEIQATTKGLEYAASKGMAVIIMEPVKGGRLANPDKKILEIMEKAPIKRSPVDWALQFVWNRPEVSVVLSGMGSMQMVKENVESAKNSGIGKLSQEELKVLDEINYHFKKLILVPCTSCQYCMPCPSGVAIPTNFRIINDYSQSKNKKRALKEYKKLASNEKSLNSDKTNGSAAVCTNCKACLPKCPQKINIPVELEKIRKVFEQGEDLYKIFEVE